MRLRPPPDLVSFGFSPEEISFFRSPSGPEEIQDLIDAIPPNYEEGGPTLRSAQGVVRARKAHCIEGAFVAALLLWCSGRRPLLLDLRAERPDWDHVVALFQDGGRWGAISKSNHPVLRYRDPVYETLRELTLSYFHEYYGDDGEKSLRAYSRPFDLSVPGRREWIASGEDCWETGAALDDFPHQLLFPRGKLPHLRLVDPLMRGAFARTAFPRRTVR